MQRLHPVEGGACLEPFNLCLVEAVVELEGVGAAVTVLHDCAQRLRRAGREESREVLVRLFREVCKMWRRVNVKKHALTFPGVKVWSPLMEILSSGRILS